MAGFSCKDDSKEEISLSIFGYRISIKKGLKISSN
jgi:hypothetical protein